MLIPEGPIRRFIRQCFGALSAIGLLISLWAQVVALAGFDPRQFFPRIWLVEPSLTVVALPLMLAVFRKGVDNNPFDLSSRSRAVMFCLMAYYVIQFYVFLYRAANNLLSSQAWQMFSAGWIVIFALAFIYYLTPRPRRR